MEKLDVKNKENGDKTIKWYHAKTSNIVALISILGLFVLIICLFIWDVPLNNQQLMTYLVGSFQTMIGGAIYYLFRFKKEEKN